MELERKERNSREEQSDFKCNSDLNYEDADTDVAIGNGIKSKETDTTSGSRDTLSRLSLIINRKRAYSLFLCLAFFIFGWVYDQMGPAILDLQENTSVSFTLASVYMMSVNIGHIVGSLGGGVLSGKINTYLLLFMSISGVALAVAVIPWCFSFTPMLIAHIIQGVFGGCLDSVVLAEMLSVWGYDAESPMQALYFSFAFGSILSPICVTPFLKVLENDDGHTEISTHIQLNSTTHAVPLYNASLSFYNNATEQSLLYIPYSISAGLSILAAIPFLFVFLNSVCRGFKIPYVNDDVRNSKSISSVLRLVVLVVMGAISALDTAMEDAAGDFLTAFCVSHLLWTKQNGAFATAVFNGSFAFGRLVGIVEAIYIKPQNLLTCYTFIMVLACIAFMISAHFMFNAGIWVCSSLIGIAMSVVSPSIFSLTEDKFFPVTGKVASFFVITACIGSGINSFFIGYLMDTFAALSLVYVLLSESILIFCLVLAVLYLIFKIKSPGSKSHDHIEKDVDLQRESREAFL